MVALVNLLFARLYALLALSWVDKPIAARPRLRRGLGIASKHRLSPYRRYAFQHRAKAQPGPLAPGDKAR